MKLTPRQEELLRQIVQTNGGGVAINDARVFLALHRRGLAHQKLGNAYRAVHTRDGLEWVRANPSPRAMATPPDSKAPERLQPRSHEKSNMGEPD